jgi:hypothetical protein
VGSVTSCRMFSTMHEDKNCNVQFHPFEETSHLTQMNPAHSHISNFNLPFNINTEHNSTTDFKSRESPINKWVRFLDPLLKLICSCAITTAIATLTLSSNDMGS